MQWLTTLILAGVLVGTQMGCASWVAFKMPGPANDDAVKIGMHRIDVESLLGVPPASQFRDHGKTRVWYKYADGPNQLSKMRSLVYVGGDVFTLFLSEIIFWPVELYAEKRIQRIGSAEYDRDNLLVTWTVSRANGETLVHHAASPVHDDAGGTPEVASGPPAEASGTPEVASEPPAEASGTPEAAREPPAEASGTPEAAREPPAEASGTPEAAREPPAEGSEAPDGADGTQPE